MPMRFVRDRLGRLHIAVLVLFGVIGGMLFWLIDIVVDAVVFKEGPIARQLFHPRPQEIWIRVFAFCMIAGSSYLVARMSTMRKKTEVELERAHTRIRDEKAWSESIIDAVADGVSVQDREYRILYQNRAHRGFLGDHVGGLCYEAYENRSSVCTGCPVARTFEDGGTHTDIRTVEIGGVTRHFEITASPLFGASGEIIAGIEAVREITARVHAERQLRESEQKFRTIFEDSREVFYISTREGRFIDISPASVDLFGYASKEELLQADIGRDLYADPADRKRFIDIVNRTGYVKEYEVQMKRRNGERLWVVITSTAQRGPQGEVTGFRGMIRDVTEHRKLEQQLLQSQKMEAIGLLAGGIAHDFNNILTAILGYGNVLRLKLQQDEQLRGYADQVIEAAKRAAGLTKDILAFSRKQIMHPEPVDLNGIIARVKNFLVRIIGEDIALKTVLHGGEITVMADTSQIEQVLVNLATNARDAMPGGGSIVLETSIAPLDDDHARAYGLGGPGRYAVVTVADTGSGFDEATQERIFEPFFTTKEAGKGTGLGLSIVHGIVSQHNGHIMVESAPDKGTTFRIYLPLAPRKGNGSEADAAEPETPGGTETVLLAEDDRTVRDFLRRTLEDAGYTVMEAENGADAVRLYREHSHRISLLILDVVMPGLNGKEAFDAIRGWKHDARALFISGYASDIMHGKGILDSSVDFIFKPFSGDVLLRTVRTVIDR